MIPVTRGLKQPTFIPQGLSREAGKFKIQVPDNTARGEHSLPAWQMVAFSLCLHISLCPHGLEWEREG